MKKIPTDLQLEFWRGKKRFVVFVAKTTQIASISVTTLKRHDFVNTTNQDALRLSYSPVLAKRLGGDPPEFPPGGLSLPSLVIDIDPQLPRILWILAEKVIRLKRDRYWGDTQKPHRNRVYDKYVGWLGELAFKNLFKIEFEIEDIKRGDGGIDFQIGPHSGQSKYTKWKDGFLCFYPWDKKIAEIFVGVVPHGHPPEPDPPELHNVGMVIKGWITQEEFNLACKKQNFDKGARSRTPPYASIRDDDPDCVLLENLWPIEELLWIQKEMGGDP